MSAFPCSTLSPRLSNSRWGWCYVKRAMQNAWGSLGMMRRYVNKTTRCPLCFQTDTAMQTTDGKVGRSGYFWDAML